MSEDIVEWKVPLRAARPFVPPVDDDEDEHDFADDESAFST